MRWRPYYRSSQGNRLPRPITKASVFTQYLKVLRDSDHSSTMCRNQTFWISLLGVNRKATRTVFPASSMTIAFGVRDTRYHGDKSYHANYHVKSQFSFVENGVFKQKRYLFFNDPALYIRSATFHNLANSQPTGRMAVSTTTLCLPFAVASYYPRPVLFRN